MAQANSLTQVVIVGGGFGGVRAARQLSRQAGLQITLVSDRDSFAYYPQLYHAATGGVRSEAALPLTEVLAGTGVKTVIDAMVGLDAAKHQLTTAGGQTIAYHYVILALGNVTNYFGIKGMEEYSYSIKTIEGAEAFKQHLHQALVTEKRPDAHYVVVGAGPTGVELSSVLGQYLQSIVASHQVAAPHYQVDLVEAAPRILPRSDESVSARVQQRLERLGVKVMTATAVEGETADTLSLKGADLATKTVIWTAGVANHPFYKSQPESFNLAKNGRVVVDAHLQGAPDVYVIGDNADTTYSGLAQTAVNDADFVAADLRRQLAGGSRPAYQPTKPMTVIPVGHGWALVEWRNLRIYGRVGWWLRRLADLASYRHIESSSQALRVWLQEPKHQDDCPICDPRRVQ